MSLTELLQASQRTQQEGRHRIYGVVTGIVRDLADPQGLGRVKVDFPWMGESSEAVSISSDDDRAHSYWARLALPMAGSGRGFFFIPEVGDEVLVAFEHGDPDRPFVIGSLWNSDQPPPEEMDGSGENNVRSITSRSGHKIVLDDGDNTPGITVVDNTGDNKIFIDTTNNAMEITVSGNLTINAGGDIDIKADGNISVSAQGNIASEAQGNIEQKSTGNTTAEATGSLSLKGMTATFEGDVAAKVKGGAEAKVEGGAMAVVKGGIVMIN